MIVVKLMGGLGNQMFQYSLAKSLSIIHNTECKVDLSFLQLNPEGKYTPRQYELNVFEEKIEVISSKELEEFLKKYNSSLKQWLTNRLPSFFPKHLLVEKGHGYQSDVFNCSKNAYLSGFWQSEKYFRQFENELKNSFHFKKEFINDTNEFKQSLSKCNSVSLHVRRGDYISNQFSKEFHGSCSIEYYYSAINIIAQKYNNIKFFVFSDDIEWCKTNLKMNHDCFFIDSGSQYKDMYLMQLCKHNIIANSSFSWWGAWLNSNAEKTVIAPKKWFINESVNTGDVIPDKWIKI